MSRKKYESAASMFLDEYKDFRKVMHNSKNFAEIKKLSAIKINDEQLYIVRSDNFGDEDDLFLDTLARGAHSSDQNLLENRLFAELSEEQQRLFIEKFKIAEEKK